MTLLLDARGIGKHFLGVQALEHVDIDLHAGEVHAIVGENGAGKSTLVKIFSGDITEYDGTVAMHGVVLHLASPHDAIESGIAVIPQELQLVNSLTVAENILLGNEPRSGNGLIDTLALHQAARQLLDVTETRHVPTTAVLGTLDAADRQMVAIARALSLNARCLVMDEPTAALGAAESDRLARIVRRLTAMGTGVIYISHQLDEVRRIADRITVLRDGHRVATRLAADLDDDEMVRLMCGRQIVKGTLIPVATGAPPLLEVVELAVRDPRRPSGYRLQGISFTVRRGEIVGLAGLVGAGRTDLLLALVGGGSGGRVEGTIRLDGAPYLPSTPADARDAGMVMLPEERKSSGIFPHLGVDHNVTMSALQRVSRFGWLDRRKERTAARHLIADAGIHVARPDIPINTLSGGNQQKALLARSLFVSPKVLLLDEPTRGIDLAAKAEFYAELSTLAANGFGVVLCSSDMSEILARCHRMLVFREGRIVASFDRDDATEENVLGAAAGRAAGSSTPDGGDRPRPRSFRETSGRYAGALGLLLVMLLAIVTSPVRGGRIIFIELGNLTDILRQVAERGILAVGMTAVIIAGGIDLSVGSVLAFAATMSAWLWMKEGLGFGPSVVLVIAVGALWGLLNGIVIARWRLPAFIATLATMSAARGAARYLSGGAAIPVAFGSGGAPGAVRSLAAPIAPYLPAPALIFGLAALAMHLYLARTRSGRYVYAIGDNETAARLAGVRVARHKATGYVICGALAAVAGLVHCAQLEQGNPNDGVSYELDAIAAVVIGGTALSGGVGTVGGTIVGVLIIGIINNSMGLNNVDANLQLILKGIIILTAVWLQRRK